MNLYLVLSKLCFRFLKARIPNKFMKAIAMAEELDEFIEVEDSQPGLIDYTIVHGFRILYADRPGYNQFVVAKKEQALLKIDHCHTFICWVANANHPSLVVL